MFEIYNGVSLSRCRNCNRTFSDDAYAKHIKVATFLISSQHSMRENLECASNCSTIQCMQGELRLSPCHMGMSVSGINRVRGYFTSTALNTEFPYNVLSLCTRPEVDWLIVCFGVLYHELFSSWPYPCATGDCLQNGLASSPTPQQQAQRYE
jgi:hypothetical protein